MSYGHTTYSGVFMQIDSGTEGFLPADIRGSSVKYRLTYLHTLNSSTRSGW